MKQILPIARLRKDEIVWLFNHHCREHRHRFTEHYGCYLRENPDREKVGFFDIETSGLYADFGFVLSYCIKLKGGKTIKNCIKGEEIKNYTFDKRLMADLIKDLTQFDRIVVYWGKDRRHDMPFVRTRALKWNLPFPQFGSFAVNDLYDIVKNKLKFTRNSMANACDFFGIVAKLHPLKGDVWYRALAGDDKSLKYVLKHNIEDVLSTEELWDKIVDYARINNTSL